MTKAIWFDMDGTIANFYGIPDWLECLNEGDTYPYRAAKPLLNMTHLARLLNRLQSKGWHIGIVSWTSKCGTSAFNAEIEIAKLEWLNRHLRSVHWDEIHIIPYGTPKHEVVSVTGILFDDELRNRENWTDTAYDVDDILGVLKSLF